MSSVVRVISEKSVVGKMSVVGDEREVLGKKSKKSVVGDTR